MVASKRAKGNAFHPYYRSEGWLRLKYITQGLSARKIGQLCGVQAKRICIWLRKFNIDVKSGASFIKGLKRTPEQRKNYRRIGPNHNQWRGGVQVHQSGGYVYVYIAPRKHKLRSHVVVEEVIGRAVREEECVHHINGDRQDDRPENLMVMPKGEHIRMHQLMRYSKNDKH
jgi:hypothetical protein